MIVSSFHPMRCYTLHCCFLTSDLQCRLNKCGVISPRYDIKHTDIEDWVARLLPSRLVAFSAQMRAVGLGYYRADASRAVEQCLALQRVIQIKASRGHTMPKIDILLIRQMAKEMMQDYICFFLAIRHQKLVYCSSVS